MGFSRSWRGAGARALLAAAAVWLASCGLFTTKIADIKAAPQRYEGQTVTIAGNVTSTTNLLMVKYYKVSDGTGEMIVVTQSPLPKEGDKVRAKGTVKTEFAIGPNRVMVLVEEPPAR